MDGTTVEKTDFVFLHSTIIYEPTTEGVFALSEGPIAIPKTKKLNTVALPGPKGRVGSAIEIMKGINKR